MKSERNEKNDQMLILNAHRLQPFRYIFIAYKGKQLKLKLKLKNSN